MGLSMFVPARACFPPFAERLGFSTPHHSDAWLGCSSTLHYYALEQSWTFFTPGLVNFLHGLSWRVHIIFCVFFHNIAMAKARLQSELFCMLCCNSLRCKWSWSTMTRAALCMSPSSNEVDMSQAEPWAPNWIYASAEVFDYSHHHNARKGRTSSGYT